MRNMETMETYSQPCDESGLAALSSTKKNSFLLVKTTSDVTLDGTASIGLTQEQPEERIGPEKDPRRVCL